MYYHGLGLCCGPSKKKQKAFAHELQNKCSLSHAIEALILDPYRTQTLLASAVAVVYSLFSTLKNTVLKKQ